MFTGLIEAVGHVEEVQTVAGAVRLRIRTALAPEMRPGDSLAVNGVCLTATVVEAEQILADIGPETLRVTTLGSMRPQQLVNLERAMRADARFGGHFVQGHVDGTGTVASVDTTEDGVRIRIEAGSELLRYCVEKGSITVDGVSLTVAAIDETGFEVALIPHTLEVTTLGELSAGDDVNLETDVLAKYVEKLLPGSMRP